MAKIAILELPAEDCQMKDVAKQQQDLIVGGITVSASTSARVSGSQYSSTTVMASATVNNNNVHVYTSVNYEIIRIEGTNQYYSLTICDNSN